MFELCFQSQYPKWGTVAHACNPSTREGRGGRLEEDEFKGTLGYVVKPGLHTRIKYDGLDLGSLRLKNLLL